jgi:hypothetical protein
MKATLKPLGRGEWTWSVKLGGRLPRGRYKIAVWARDGFGNTSTKLASGRPSLRIGR